MSTPKTTAADVRTWLRSKGHPVGARGPLSSELVEIYNKGRRGSQRYTLPARQRASA